MSHQGVQRQNISTATIRSSYLAISLRHMEVKRYRMMIRALLHPILHEQGKPTVRRQENGCVRIYLTGEIRKK
ncbi:hypothetical protein C8R21_11746 [Nitrosospira multiformis]|uniref:Uncharacterized protein n=1 Tax=Nitrosospira multiformis TaxID=1231 RepID=A0A2T5I940_9PROT|nr:hypothetical protein C8R21_11746 [Nitrosospira multiformis]